MFTGLYDFFCNLFSNRNRYRQHSEACIVACFFNPQNSPYRLLAFQKWYHSIKHLNHKIVECLIGPDAKSQLPESPNISQVRADSLLFHKEAMLNLAIEDLPPEIKYIFWVDADVIFTNLNWLRDGVRELQTANVIQPFEYCVHLEKNQIAPNFNVDLYRNNSNIPGQRHPAVWRSFCATYVIDAHENTEHSSSINYDEHGHVGFAWGIAVKSCRKSRSTRRR